jgi:hypothetical protein
VEGGSGGRIKIFTKKLIFDPVNQVVELTILTHIQDIKLTSSVYEWQRTV